MQNKTPETQTTGQAKELKLNDSISSIRKRARILQLQAFLAIVALIVGAIGIAYIFVSLHQLAGQSFRENKSRDPYDYRLMEARHEAISGRLKEFSDSLSDAKHELITDKYGKNGANQDLVIKMLQDRSSEIVSLRADLENRLAKDRQNMYIEILQLKTERDRAKEDSAEKRSFIRLFGDAIMRIGVLVLAIYLISIVSNIAKYWLRVADHLISIADSLDLLRFSGLGLESAIASLTPHPIDFQVEEINIAKTAKDLLSTTTSATKSSS